MQASLSLVSDLALESAEPSPSSAEGTRISAFLVALTILVFLPQELSFYIADFRLTLARLLLIFLTPVLVLHFGLSLASGRRHIVPADLLIASASIWMIAAPTIVFDLGYALHHAAPLAVEFCGSYVATRILLSQRGQALRFIEFLCHAIGIVALLALPDALTGTPFIHDVLAKITGYHEPYSLEYRLGIFRSTGPIDHPILFGSICGFGLLLAIVSPIRARRLTISACGLGVMLSMSSAPLQAAVIGLGLVVYDWLFRRVRSRWWLLTGIMALGVAAIFAYSNDPMGFVFSHFLFDSSSGWVRYYEWGVAGGLIRNSPWVGIAFQYAERLQEMPDLWYSAPSIDSYWLNLSLVYGIPCATCVGLAIGSLMCSATNGPRANFTDIESILATALGIVLVIIVLLGFTVDFWGSSWMVVPLLAGARAHLAELASRRVALPAEQEEPGAPCLRMGA